ncbi:MAG: sensor histidine kinase [Methanobrevibacter sp.]|nr:sensor histidine kinase [Methanobrevibacter sp.]
MENANFNPDEKRLLLKDYNHRLNNDLQAVLAFIKLKKRFGIDDDEIVTFSCVSIASISAIQNLMYNTDNSENLIGVNEFFEEFIKILNDYYSKFNLRFFNEIKTDFYIDPKEIFHLMLLINEMVNLSLDFSFKDDSEHSISLNLEKSGEECLLTYSDNGSGIKETISESNLRTALFEQSVKQIDGVLEPSDANSTILIKFSCE